MRCFIIFRQSEDIWTVIIPAGLFYPYSLKLRYYEKATKFEKISHRFWQNSCLYSVASKQVGDFFKILWPFQKSWTLHKECSSVFDYSSKKIFTMEGKKKLMKSLGSYLRVIIVFVSCKDEICLLSFLMITCS